MNIVLENDNLRCVNFDDGVTYNLDEFAFYIPKKHKDVGVFLIVKQKSLYDIIELKKTSSSNLEYDRYVCEFGQIKIKSGQSEISLIELTIKDGRVDCCVSTPFVLMNLDTGNYITKSEAVIIKSISQSIYDMYQKMNLLYLKMIDISKLNFEMISGDRKEEADG